MSANEELVASGLRVMRGPLSIFVCQGIEKHYGESWWTQGVLETLVSPLTPTVKDVRRYRRLPEAGSVEDCAASIDIAVCLILLTKHWFRIFGPMLGEDHKNDRAWAFELIGVRTQNAHPTARHHASDFAWRALDTMYRLIEPINSDAATDLVALRSSVDLSEYGQAGSKPTATAAPRTGPNAGLIHPLPVSEPEPATSEDADLDDDLAAAGPDFSGADLRKMNFAGANLEGADFEGANLTGANLKGARLVGANFKDATLADADLSTSDLTRAHFEGTTLSAYFDKERTSYSRSQWHGANLAGATLDGATLNFANCELRAVTFGAVNLEGANFEGANLTGANLKGARLRGVNLRNANTKDTDTTDVQWI